MASQNKYSPPTIILHWLFAVTIITVFILGKVLVGTEISPTKLNVFMTHAALGGLTGLFLVYRIILLFKHARPAPDPSWNIAMRAVSKLVHLLLYLAPLALVLSGMSMSLLAGLMNIAIAGDWQAWPINITVLPVELHGLAAPVLLASFALHVAGALYHQFIMKDNLMARMKTI
ncbi:cytochrome b/b6 domain-containing protein [Pseudovibrio sp. Tun.PSC04-5.I4]|uniref:cytochrome b n=1 Tax=Pseudovibrio sp. Tun.PSC04-5.I4 TaxID=1798213 RepID=UPI000889228E|nr:cytochrome b/b6 domain-containing protein [Pseudovibrio sp. Tun.PSC04-5.I4]SDR28216.1 cytochrome b561 [Pseudovibrio sp. Tun.PSC04-5.I4]